MKYLVLLLVLISTISTQPLNSMLKKPMRKVLLKQGSSMYYQKDTRADLVFFGVTFVLPEVANSSGFKPGAAALLAEYLKNHDRRFRVFEGPDSLPVSNWVYDSDMTLMRMLCTFLSEDTENVVQSWLQMFKSPKWNPNRFSKIKQRLIKHANRRKSELGYKKLLGMALTEVYGSQVPSVRLQTTASDFSKVTLEDVKKLHKELCNPLRMKFTVLGNVGLKKIANVLHKSLADFQVKDIPNVTTDLAFEMKEKQHYGSVKESGSILLFKGPEIHHRDAGIFMALPEILLAGMNSVAEKYGNKELADYKFKVVYMQDALYLALYSRDGEHSAKEMAENWFQILDLFKNNQSSEKDMNTIKGRVKSSIFETMTHPMLFAILTQQLATFDSKYVLPNEQFRALEQSDAKVIQKICNKYLSFDNYVFVSIEPEKNRSEKKIKSTTLGFNKMKVVVEEDPNQDMIGICWSFQVPEKEDPRVAYLAGWAMAAKSHQLKNKTIQQELEKVNPMFPMFMLKDKLTSFGQVSTAYWRNSLHKLLPHMIFGREVLEQDLDLARKIIASQIKKFDGSYKSLEYLYKSTFPEKPIQWFYLWDKAKELDSITIEQVQSYVDRVMIPENCHLVINGNITAKEAKKLFGKSLKTVMTMDEDSVVESGKKVSLRSRLHQLRKQIKQVSSKTPAMSSLAPVAKCMKKRFKSEGDEFASFVGTIASVDSLSVREHAALVIFGSHFSHVFKSMYADSGISATFYAGSSDLNLPIVMIISGDVEEFPKVEEYLTNALKECEKCGDDTKMQNYIIKAVRLNKNYTNLDRGTYALTANLLLQQGFDSNYMNQLMKNLETMTLKEAHRIFKKAYKKDFKIDFVPEG